MSEDKISCSVEKKRLRSMYLGKRNNLPWETWREHSEQIAAHLEEIEEYRSARNVMFYLTLGWEVDTESLVARCLAGGQRVFVPFTCREKGELIPCLVRDLDLDLEKGTFGIREPREGKRAPQDPQDIDVVIVPGSVFDREGYRIGFGGGYYDNLLGRVGSQTVSIGLAFEFQVVEAVPRAPHDRPVDMLVTEVRLRKFPRRT